MYNILHTQQHRQKLIRHVESPNDEVVHEGKGKCKKIIESYLQWNINILLPIKIILGVIT